MARRRNVKLNQVFGFRGIERIPMDEAVAGDIVLVTGIDELSIGCNDHRAERARSLADAQD